MGLYSTAPIAGERDEEGDGDWDGEENVREVGDARIGVGAKQRRRVAANEIESACRGCIRGSGMMDWMSWGGVGEELWVGEKAARMVLGCSEDWIEVRRVIVVKGCGSVVMKAWCTVTWATSSGVLSGPSAYNGKQISAKQRADDKKHQR